MRDHSLTDLRSESFASSIPEQFAIHVARDPGREAVCVGASSLTYGQLDQRGSTLAELLLGELGTRSEPVCLFVEKSLNQIVGLLGILGAGKCAVPLDPSDPRPRLEHMLGQTAPQVVLTDSSQRDRCEDLVQGRSRVIDLDICGLDRDVPTALDRPAIAPDSLATILFTSGSTGEPKGVMQTHRNWLHAVFRYANALGLAKEDRLFRPGSFGFAAGIRALFGSLTCGATLFTEGGRRLEDLDKMLARHRVTLLHTPVNVLRLLFESNSAEDLSHLRCIFVAGDALRTEDARQFRTRFPKDTQLIHALALTECSTIRQCIVDDNLPMDGKFVPVGYAVEDMEILLLDSGQNPVRNQSTGLIAVRSHYLSPGYWQRPDLTDQSFLPDPDGSDKRIYLTGDVGQIQSNGLLVHLGRQDSKVKIRGFQVEPRGVSNALAAITGVRDCAVIPQDKNGEKQLVAFVVRDVNAPLTTQAIRGRLAESLPDYMIPSTFVFLDEIPRNPHGKLDFHRLTAVEGRRPDLESQYIAPRTAVERVLTAIWSEVLGVERIGVNDDFFALGGHSLAATRMVMRASGALVVDISVRNVFESPTIAKLSSVVEALRSSGQSVRANELKRVGREPMNRLPLSFAQERLWFFDQFEPASPVYNIPRILRLRGRLNVPALARSLQEFVRRHEVLRTSFANADGQPQTVLHDATEFGLTVTDLRRVPENERESDAQRLAVEEIGRPFELSQDLMLRAQLWLLGEQDHVLAVTMHHIASDGWSFGVFVQELRALYAAYSTNQPSPLPELPIQYADYAAWQRKWLQGAVLERQLAYWKQQLSGGPAVLELPTDFPRPAVQSYRGGSQKLVLSAGLTHSLQELSRREKVTPFMTLLAAFHLLLSRLSGQDDVSVGAPIAGRNRAQVEGLAGMFVNTLVLRTDLSGNPTFRELLRRERVVTLGAYANQDLPFEKLVEDINPPRLLDRHPLCEVLLNHLNLPSQRPELAGLDCQSLDLGEPQSKFLMTLYVGSARELRLNLVYRQELFTAERMSLFLAQFVAILEQAVANPQLRLDAFSLITPECRGLLPDPTLGLNEPAYLPVTRLFRDWADRTPARIAVSQEERKWTYEDVQRMSEGLAQELVTRGVRPGDVVALHGTRNFGTIVGMLGVLASRCVLLLVDADLPGGRKALMLDEAAPQVFVEVGSSPWPETWCREHPGVIRIELDPETAAMADGKSQKLAEGAHEDPRGDDAAYIFFTSGTTGIPKGIVGCHKGLSHFLDWQRSEFAIGPDDRVAQLTSLSFDVVMREVFLPLTSGGTLCLPDGIHPLDLNELIPWLKRRQITVMHTVSSLVEFGLDGQLSDLSLPELRRVFFVGEPLTDQLVRRLRGVIAPDCELINLYGTTETGPAKCFYRVPAQPLPGIQPIGKAIPESQALVLANRTRLCGLGERGEIAVRTPFLAQGYLKANGENGFAKNPFRNDSADCLYFTGDCGRYRPDGTLEILGRQDDQIKIRGVRIEPQGVARVLSRHPSVRTCAVLPIAAGDDSYLAAYVVPRSPAGINSNELRSFLANDLLPTMVPWAFVVLDNLPLTPNGKVDRAALPVPEARDTMVDAVAPDDVLELQLARIWEDVLNVRPIGVCDNFFELGGHSLVAVRLFDRVARVTGQSLPLATLFECPTIRHLADALRRRNWSPPWKSLVPIQPGGSKPPLFVVPPAGGSVLRFAELARNLGPDQPVFGFEPIGHDAGHEPHHRVEDMASLYLKELRELQPTGPYLLAGRCFGGHVIWEMARQLSAQGGHVALVALLDPRAPAHGPTWSPTRRTILYYGRRALDHLATGQLLRAVLNRAIGRLRRIRSWQNAAGRRQLRLRDAHRMAQVSYVGCPFAGRVVLIQSEEFSLRQEIHQRWFELAEGDFDSVVVSGTTHRDLLLGGPFTPTLAEHLREHLDRAVCEPLPGEPTMLPDKSGSHIAPQNATRRAA